jgi:hypothetical protein
MAFKCLGATKPPAPVIAKFIGDIHSIVSRRQAGRVAIDDEGNRSNRVVVQHQSLVNEDTNISLARDPGTG